MYKVRQHEGFAPSITRTRSQLSRWCLFLSGAAKVGKSSLLLCMKGIDLPVGKPDASIQTLFLPKGDRGVHLIFRDCGVSKSAWDAWNADPANRQVITSATSGAMGREVQIFVYAADAKVSPCLLMPAQPIANTSSRFAVHRLACPSGGSGSPSLRILGLHASPGAQQD